MLGTDESQESWAQGQGGQAGGVVLGNVTEAGTKEGIKPETTRELLMGSHRAGQPRCGSRRVVMWGRDRTGAASAGR